MDDAEIKDSIRAGVRVGKVLGISNAEKGKSSFLAAEIFPCEPDHQGVYVNAVEPARVKYIVNEFRPFASATADLDAKGG